MHVWKKLIFTLIVIIAFQTNFVTYAQQQHVIKHVDKMKASGKVDQVAISTVHEDFYVIVTSTFKGTQNDVEKLNRSFHNLTALQMNGVSFGGKKFLIQEAENHHIVGKSENGTTNFSAAKLHKGVVVGLSDGSAEELSEEVKKTAHRMRSHGF